MSLDRNHPVFLGHPKFDQIEERYRVRSLDDEIGERTLRWRYRRYICMLGNPGCGKRSLARRFFQDRGELKVDGNYWLRGIIYLTIDSPFKRGEMDLLIRIVPGPLEGYPQGLVLGAIPRPMEMRAAVGKCGNASLFIFAFNCAKLMYVFRVHRFYEVVVDFMKENMTTLAFVGTMRDQRLSRQEAHRLGYLDEDEIKEELMYTYKIDEERYVECSVKNNDNVHAVINTALRLIL